MTRLAPPGCRLPAVYSPFPVSPLHTGPFGGKIVVMRGIPTAIDNIRIDAFNAALEASSAGEAGKRFSVVAGEIRRLADSVTDSTREIEAKISEIQDSISRLVITSEKEASGITAGLSASATTA